MPKVAILHPGIYGNPKNDALTTSFLADVTVVRYAAGMTKEELLAVIPSGLTHLSFVYHYPGYSRLPFFADRSGISGVSGEQPKYRYFSDTVIDILRSVSSVADRLTVDILSCNLNEAAYAEEVKKIETDLGINIRYSVDKTGNPSSGANWILESEELTVNVRDIYFTDGVLAWNSMLAGDISQAIKDGSGNCATYISWNAPTFTVLQDFSWTDISFGGNSVTNADYIELSGNEIFNGAGYKIDISGLSWDGLIASSATSFLTAPLIKNLGVINGDIGVPSGGGAIVRLGQQFFKVENCYSTGAITGLFAGGIAGGSAGGGGECDISGCYSTGDISGQDAGGIVGLIAGGGGGLCRITNCYSTGDIIGPTAGGIAGEGAGQLGSCIITNCYSSGDIIGADAGGIAGQNAGNDGTCTITDCYNTGDINGVNAGGIAGANAGTDGTCIISGCYSTGDISGNNAGGIAGLSASLYGICIISECYSTGPIIGGRAGGIAGSDAGNDGICDISSCYSLGAIIGTDAGGIAGALAAGTVSGSICTITDCYSAGDISGGSAGGIAGANAEVTGGTCTIICCVCNGGTIFGNGIPIDPIDCSTDLADISGVIFPCWLPSLIWDSSGGPVPPTNYNLPILTRFRNSPWDSAFYNAADDPAKFITPPVVLTNTFPLRVNPYIAIGTILVYTNSFIRALVAGTTLPNPGRTAWSANPLPAGTLLKPLGRSAVVNGTNKLAIYRFENVQLINGSSSEGVPSGDATGRWYTGWICTWSADGVAPVFP
jgi:hypothetical protein